MFYKHILWLKDNLGEQISSKIEGENTCSTVDEFLNDVCAVDPTPAKEYVDWMVRCWLADGIKSYSFKNSTQIRVLLNNFRIIRGQLPKEQRNIYHYNDLSQLGQVLSVLDEKNQDISGKQKKRDEKAKAWAESIIIHHSKDCTIAAPLTHRASQWWGKGTRWCTASEKDIMFFSYFNRAPLIVFVIKTGEGEEKFQLHFSLEGDRGLQFMDAQDRKIGLQIVEKYWPQLSPLIHAWFLRNSKVFEFFPDSFKTYEICGDAVERSADNIKHVPNALKTEGMCETVLKLDSDYILYIPQHLLTTDMCKIAVESKPRIFPSIPVHLLDRELMILGLLLNGSNITGFPEPLITPDIIKIALGGEVDIEDQTPMIQSFIARGISIKPCSLLQIGDRITEQNCWWAVQYDGSQIRYVPERWLDQELCELAVEVSADALYWIPDHLKTIRMCLSATTRSHRAIEWVPEHLITPEIRELSRESYLNIVDEYQDLKSQNVQNNTDRIMEYAPPVEYVYSRKEARQWDMDILKELGSLF